MLRSTINRQRRRLNALKPVSETSTDWSRYGPHRHYSDETLKTKDAFVERALEELRPGRVIDLGCNDDTYSNLAAKRGASVIAADLDVPSLEHAHEQALIAGHDIQPVRVNLAQPSPASGWQGRERLSFDDRLNGHVDMVLALAVIHHLQMAERIPLPEITEWLAAMTRDCAVIEYVGPDDPMAKGLIAARRAPVAYVDADAFDAVFEQVFDIIRCESLPGMDRRMLLLKKR